MSSEDVAFRVLEEHQRADADDDRLLHHDLAAIRDNGLRRLVVARAGRVGNAGGAGVRLFEHWRLHRRVQITGLIYNWPDPSHSEMT